MITRGIVIEVGSNENVGKLRVRVPIYHGMSPNDHESKVEQKRKGSVKTYNGLSDDEIQTWSSILYIPGIIPNYHVGDIVIITFENLDIDMPLVLGLLYSAVYNEVHNFLDGSDTQYIDHLPSMVVGDIAVNGSAKLSDNTQIGSLSASNLIYAMNPLME